MTNETVSIYVGGAILGCLNAFSIWQAAKRGKKQEENHVVVYKQNVEIKRAVNGPLALALKQNYDLSLRIYRITENPNDGDIAVAAKKLLDAHVAAQREAERLVAEAEAARLALLKPVETAKD